MRSRQIILLGGAVAAAIVACLVISWGGYAFRTDRVAAGEASYQQGDWPKAAEQARSILKSTPDDKQALRLLARASARLGKDETAESIYRRLGTGGMDPEDLFLLGQGLLRRGQTSPGLAALGAALDADPDHPESLFAMITYLIEQQSLTQAARDAEHLMYVPGWEIPGMVALAKVRHELLD